MISKYKSGRQSAGMGTVSIRSEHAAKIFELRIDTLKQNYIFEYGPLEIRKDFKILKWTTVCWNGNSLHKK